MRVNRTRYEEGFMNSDRSMWSRVFSNRAQRHVQAVRLCAVLAGLGLLAMAGLWLVKDWLGWTW